MLNLESGRRYIRRNGTITPPLEQDGSYLIDPAEGFGYVNGPGGDRVFGLDGPDDPCDLISEAQLQ